ncbi:MAG: hypothetical protein CMH54_01020 [Myxococcales bacterium]|nr:hypothetical protein [Myxococcales bacterium]|tara:strand:+ start:748 stop:1350 length:603 start_codon:yes stop_codon:yes gene_type:complete
MGGSTQDHDDVSLEEIVKRIERAERDLAEARSMLAGMTSERTEPEESPGTPAPTPAPAEIDPESGIAIAILNRHRPPNPGDTFRMAIISLFRLAIDTLDDEDAVQECLRRLVHSNVGANVASFSGFYRFNWSRFLKLKAQYLASSDDPESFHIVRTDPVETKNASRVKVFLAASGRSPAPLVVEMDSAHGGGWRISEVSL